jgi:hypothetical protein
LEKKQAIYKNKKNRWFSLQKLIKETLKFLMLDVRTQLFAHKEENRGCINKSNHSPNYRGALKILWNLLQCVSEKNLAS